MRQIDKVIAALIKDIETRHPDRGEMEYSDRLIVEEIFRAGMSYIKQYVKLMKSKHLPAHDSGQE